MKFNINKRAIDYIASKGGNLIITVVKSSCGWAGSVKSLWIEAVKYVDNIENYYYYEQDKIKIYIHKSLIIDNEITIELKAKIPLIGPLFNVKGVKINSI
jgi:hypothetical protein